MKNKKSNLNFLASETENFENFAEQLSTLSVDTTEQYFTTMPHFRVGIGYFFSIFLILSAIVYFVSPVMSILCIAIATIAKIFSFFISPKTPSSIYEKFLSRNIISSASSTDGDKQELILLSNLGSPVEKNFSDTAMKAKSIIIFVSTLGIAYQLCLAISSWIFLSFFEIPFGNQLFAGIFTIFFIPFWIALLFYNSTAFSQQCADGNRNSCQALLDVYKFFQQNPLKNTRLTIALCGGNETSFVGVKKFLDSNSTNCNIPQLFVSVDKILDENFSTLFTPKNIDTFFESSGENFVKFLDIVSFASESNCATKIDCHPIYTFPACFSNLDAFLLTKKKINLTLSSYNFDKAYQHNPDKSESSVANACDILKTVAKNLDNLQLKK